MLDPVDRFFAAVSVMAGDGNIKQRLVRAYEENLQHIDEGALPPEARQAFVELKSRMRSVAPLNGEGPIRATVRKMSPQDASACGAIMLELLATLIRATARGHGAKASRAVQERPALPPFLARSG